MSEDLIDREVRMVCVAEVTVVVEEVCSVMIKVRFGRLFTSGSRMMHVHELPHPVIVS